MHDDLYSITVIHESGIRFTKHNIKEKDLFDVCNNLDSSPHSVAWTINGKRAEDFGWSPGDLWDKYEKPLRKIEKL